MVVISVYGVKIIRKFRWKSGFLRGIPWTPLCTNGSAGYLMQLSVKKGSEIKLFLAHQMQNFIRQVDVQPPKIIV